MVSYKGKKSISIATVFVFIASLLLMSVNNGVVNAASAIATSGKSIIVKKDGSGDFTSISEAVKSVQPGDTVEVYSGTYRETVVLPRGGNDEASRITLKAAPGQKVIITGSDVVQPSEWTPDSGNVYTITKDNMYFGEFNPFATKWMSKGSIYPDFFTCGCVYINGSVLKQVFKKDDVYKTQNSWFAEVSSDKTNIWVNFGGLNPTDTGNSTEINVRKQCITAIWNQGYITIDGFTVMHGCGPKTIDFWQTVAKPMAGAIATNGGYYWIIQNCEATQNRGVAIDYGNGSRMQELQNGGEPKLYGHHIIRYCNVHDNGTNGMMAYRGPYTEIYGNTLYNNNALNTGLLSEAYIKDVSGGFGINIHNNYFYSDQDWAVYPIWLDSECDGARVSKNIFYCKGDGHGFTYVDSEVNHGWQMYDNNIFVGVGLHVMSASHNYFVNNLWLNVPDDTSKRSWPGIGKWGFIGSEGWDGYQRAMRIVVPGTLDVISTVDDPTSRFETYNRFNKMLNNVFFDNGLYTTSSAIEVSQGAYNSDNTEVVLSSEPNVNPDYSGGSWSHPEVGKLPIAWVEAKPNTVGKATIIYGNECDYNVYYGGAQKVNYQYAAARGYEADKNSKVVAGDGNNYNIVATPNSFELTLNVDDSCSTINAPAITGSYLGNTELYQQLGYDFYAPDVDTDFFGNTRDINNTVVGPFANLQVGANTFDLWNNNSKITVSSQNSNLTVGSTTQLTAAITPSSTTEQAITWTSNNPDVAIVSSNGLVTAKSTGTAAIRATITDYPSIYAECIVNVVSSGGSGGGSSSGGSTSNPTPAPKPTPVPTPTPNPTQPQKQNDLTDIKGHWAESSINKLVEMGVITGDSDKSFKPNKDITRAEFIALLVKAFRLEPKQGKAFSDTDKHWAEDYISTAAAYGITNGYSDSTFKPDDLITREQMIVMISKVAKFASKSGSKQFKDESKLSPWAKSAVDAARANGLVNGYSDGSFKPQANATKAEAVTIIVNAMEMKN